jgi:predicted RNA methylase
MTQALALFDFASGDVSEAIAEQKETIPGFVNVYESFDRAATELTRLLRANVTITEKLLIEAMTHAYGCDDRAGKWSIQTAYNALETALVKRILERRDTDPMDVEDLLDLLPTQRRRSEEKERLQQFSTPPPIAALAASVARITPFDRMLEPSAGNGLLAAFARLHGATVVLNELDPERAHGASSALGTACTSYDAGTLAVRFEGARPSVVVMNPPFSSDGFDQSSDVGFTHVQQAYDVLRAGGRLVAILGDFQHPALKPNAWTWVNEKQGSIRYAHTVEGAAYSKMGTAFSTCIVVIDKSPHLPIVSSSTEPRGTSDLFEDYPELQRADIEEQSFAKTSSLTVITNKGRRTAAWTPIFSEPLTTLKYKKNTERAIETVGAHANYVPSLIIEGAKQHPTPLIESSTLAHVDGPMPTVSVVLPERLLRNGLLSNAQFETVIYAMQSREGTFSLKVSYLDDQGAVQTEVLEDVRRGCMVGHGTGVGKGRCIATIILANVLAGRTKALWVSETQDLFRDALRDWTDVAGEAHANALVNLSSFSPNDVIPMQHGILFCTYATLRTPARQRSRSRIAQVLEWINNDPATEMFDEAHNAANAAGGRSEQGLTAASQQGMAVLELQRKTPNAHVVCTSATSASKIEAFSYAPRLGLWSTTSSFNSREQFLNSMEKGGLGAMEMIARDLKALGLYTSASLSLEGVTYDRLEHKLTPDQIEQYNAVAKAWRIIYEHTEAALESTNGGTKNRRAARAALEMARIRSLQAIVTAQKLPTVIQNMQNALEDGHQIVVQLTNTYEAQQERAIEALGDATDLELLDLSPRETIISYLERAFPTGQYRIVKNGDTVTYEPVKDDAGRQMENPEAVKLRDDLIAQVRGMVCPDGPMEILLDTFGVENVAEITGRTRRVVRTIVDGQLKRIIETRPANAGIAEGQAFNEGRKKILIFSEAAGGTGRSFHDVNGAKRCHYLLQTGWRSDRAIQGLGRTHRTFQRSAPHWVLCTSDVPGERRFLSTIAKRLEQLGACTKGQRDAVGTGLFSSDDNLETPFGTRAVKALLMRVALGHLTGMTYEQWVDQTNLRLYNSDGELTIDTIPVHRFLNKLLACDIDVQGMLIDQLTGALAEIVEVAKARGEYDFGVQQLPGLDFNVAESHSLYCDPETGATAVMLKLNVTRKTEPHHFGITLANVRTARSHHGKDEAGFRTDEMGIFAYYRLASDTKDTPYKTVRPQDASVGDYKPYGATVSDDNAKALWDEILDGMTDTYIDTEHFVTGTVLPIYGRLPESNARIYRFTTNDGARYIGRRIAINHVGSTLEQFGLTHSFSTEDLRAALSAGNAVHFKRGFSIKCSRMAGTLRNELLIPKHFTYSHGATFTNLGAIRERVNYNDRFFIPEEHLDTIISHLEQTEGLMLVGKAA